MYNRTTICRYFIMLCVYVVLVVFSVFASVFILLYLSDLICCDYPVPIRLLIFLVYAYGLYLWLSFLCFMIFDARLAKPIRSVNGAMRYTLPRRLTLECNPKTMAWLWWNYH